MTERLRTMLRETADHQSDLTLRGDPWRRGRRIRLGRRVGTLAGAVTGAVVVVGIVLLTTPDPTSTPEPAEQDHVEPALPETLYEVPLNIPDVRDDPLGEPAALVYSSKVRPGVFADEDTRPLVVGAESGQLRAVREAPSGRGPVLSPDGTMLAATDGWVWTDLDVDPDPGPPDLLVVNLVTGESVRHVLPDEGFGGGVDRLTWMPDSTVLAVTLVMAHEDGFASREVYGLLDVMTGEWHLDGDGSALAVSRDGLRTLVAEIVDSSTGSYARYAVHNRVADAQLVVDVEVGGHYGVAFSPDGRRIASGAQRGDGITISEPHLLEIFDADAGEAVGRIELGDYHWVDVLGWGERGVLVESYRVVEGPGGDGEVITVVERIDVSDLSDPARSTVVVDQSHSGRVGIPVAFLDADVRGAQPPEAPLDWAAWVPDPYLLIMFGGVCVALIIGYLIRRARSGRGSATVPGSTGR